LWFCGRPAEKTKKRPASARRKKYTVGGKKKRGPALSGPASSGGRTKDAKRRRGKSETDEGTKRNHCSAKNFAAAGRKAQSIVGDGWKGRESSTEKKLHPGRKDARRANEGRDGGGRGPTQGSD